MKDKDIFKITNSSEAEIFLQENCLNVPKEFIAYDGMNKCPSIGVCYGPNYIIEMFGMIKNLSTYVRAHQILPIYSDLNTESQNQFINCHIKEQKLIEDQENIQNFAKITFFTMFTFVASALIKDYYFPSFKYATEELTHSALFESSAILDQHV